MDQRRETEAVDQQASIRGVGKPLALPVSLEVFRNTEKSARNLIKSTRNQIVFTIFQLIWNQTDVCLDPNQSKIGKYNRISGWSNKISKKKILCVDVFRAFYEACFPGDVSKHGRRWWDGGHLISHLMQGTCINTLTIHCYARKIPIYNCILVSFLFERKLKYSFLSVLSKA